MISFTVLKYPDGTQEVVWRQDASVKYFRGKHIPLFLVALIILLIGIVYTFLLLSWQWLLPLSNVKLLKWVTNTKMTSFMDAYHAPYTPRSRYWTGVLLLARVVLYVVSAVNVSGEPSANLMAISVVVTSLFLLKFHVYKNWPIDVLETALYVNLILLSAGKFYVLYNELDYHAVLAYVSTSISLFMMVIILIYHMIYWTPIIGYWNSCLKRYVRKSRLVNENLTIGLLENDSETTTRGLSDPDVTFSVVEVDKPVLLTECVL